MDAEGPIATAVTRNSGRGVTGHEISFYGAHF